jgi:hypothetical protein
MVQRDGDLRMMHVADLKARNVQAVIGAHIAPGSTIITDEHAAFVGLHRRYNHHSVNHAKGEYVRRFTTHTNRIEGAWSLLKRQIVGIHHFVSGKHFARYVAAAEWCYNRRRMDEGARVDELIAGTSGRLTYRALVA